MGDERSRNNNNLEEVRRQLPALQQEWQNYLRRKYSRLRDQHSELIQQVAENLLVFASEHPDDKVDSWTDFSFRILQRRIVDCFRSFTRRWAESPLDEQFLPPADSVGNPERVTHYVLLLKRVVGLITSLDIKDRDLLLSGLATETFDTNSGESQRKLSVAERKQLSRLRNRLREEIDK